MMPGKDAKAHHVINHGTNYRGTVNGSINGGAYGNGKVLVVDDEEYVRTILKGMLETMGYGTIEASDGDVGLQAFDDSKKDIVACIIDLTMPGMTGMELLGSIRDLDVEIPIILVSGYSRHEVRQQEAKSPNLSFLQKPFTMEQFKSALTAQLNVAVG
jgi:two-component system cell cycle sensor histidine kinase/response regulator CckA